MNKSSFAEGLITILILIGFFYLIGTVGDKKEPECVVAGCTKSRAEGSLYCRSHKRYDRSSSSSSYDNKPTTGSGSSSSYSNKPTTGSESSYNSSTKTNSTGTSNTKKNNTGTSSSKKNNPYNSYDDGYDDVYMDGDYDYDRYYRDSDYADGVDDAMDDLDEDW